MPLVWAHAEYIKLLVSRQLGHPMPPPATWKRYQGKCPVIEHAIWLPQSPIQQFKTGQTLDIALLGPGTLHWSIDEWKSIRDTNTVDSGLGLHVAELDTRALLAGQRIAFTFQGINSGEWAGHDYSIAVVN